MRKTAFTCIILLLALLTGCREDRQFTALLDQVDSLMNTRPDSALALLQARADSIGQLPESQRMRYHLLTAKAQNKAYVDFTTDSLMLLVTDYYDHHGTANDRMMAHYLLGCCYRDMGEAPATIECYKDAVNQADTTQSDCDFRTMMSIYGQMATLYDRQAMPMEELEVLERMGWYALKCGDTLSHIISIQLESHAYDLMQDSMKVFEALNKSRDLYLSYGYIREAAQTLPLAISLKLDSKKYSEAYTLMQIYESQSGRFDEEGNISPRYSHYYNSKGMYYFGINKLDSAEYYFRKLALSERSYDAYCGLSEVFWELGIVDSAQHYRKLADNALDLRFTAISEQSVRRAAAMYDYTRNQRIAHEKEMETEQTRLIAIVLLLLLLFISGAGYFFHRLQRNKKQQEINRITSNYLRLSCLYEKTRLRARLLEEDHATFREDMKKELTELKNKMEQSQKEFEKLKSNEKNTGLVNSEIVRRLKDMTLPRVNSLSPKKADWKELKETMQQSLPYFYNFISAEDKLSEQELLVCMMVRLEFTTSELAILLETTTQRITNAKSRINHKLFSDDSARTLKRNIASI